MVDKRVYWLVAGLRITHLHPCRLPMCVEQPLVEVGSPPPPLPYFKAPI